jgi:hypothetical protein
VREFCQVLFNLFLNNLTKAYPYPIIKQMNLPVTKRKLTEKQQSFLNNLIETKGDLKLSAELAGYQGNHYQIMQSLKQEIVELAETVLAREAPKAAFKLIEVMDSETAIPQANVKLQAAQTLLDRVGVSKTERMQVNHNVSGGIFILPEKETIDINAEDVQYEDIPN